MSNSQQPIPQLYIGLMSGTSADGIDLALVDFSDNKIELKASFYQAYSKEIQQEITSLYQTKANELELAFSLDKKLAQLFAEAIKRFLQQEHLSAADIAAIGNHGQTIRHRPNQEHAFTLQIGCNQTLASRTDIRVIGDFRQKDIVLGGQGAPLVPAFHQAIFADIEDDVFIVNIGGIANITYLPKDKNNAVLGFDTGPGNGLMDEWYQQHFSGLYDENGNWAASGQIDQALLSAFLSDSYFKQQAPKSTGREVFHLPWIQQKINRKNCNAEDVQATLCALTSATISTEIKRIAHHGKVFLCGGGAYNKHLKNQLKQQLNTFEFTNLPDTIPNDALEAMAFAWLAYAYDKNIFGNIPAVTGAYEQTVLGHCIFP